MFPTNLSRRDWLKLSAAGVLGGSLSGWLGVQSTDYGGIFPNLGNFSGPLGFIT